jgi:hypothetical protein
MLEKQPIKRHLIASKIIDRVQTTKHKKGNYSKVTGWDENEGDMRGKRQWRQIK